MHRLLSRVLCFLLLSFLCSVVTVIKFTNGSHVSLRWPAVSAYGKFLRIFIVHWLCWPQWQDMRCWSMWLSRSTVTAPDLQPYCLRTWFILLPSVTWHVSQQVETKVSRFPVRRYSRYYPEWAVVQHLWQVDCLIGSIIILCRTGRTSRLPYWHFLVILSSSKATAQGVAHMTLKGPRGFNINFVNGAFAAFQVDLVICRGSLPININSNGWSCRVHWRILSILRLWLA